MRWVYSDGHGNTAKVSPLDEFFELRVFDRGSLVWRGLYRSKQAAVSSLRKMYRDMREAGREVDFRGAMLELIESGMSPREAAHEMGIDEDG